LLPGTNPKIPEVEEILAIGAAVQNMMLLATSYGLGSKWTTGVASIHAHTAEFVGLAPPARLLGFVYVGWPAVPISGGQRAGLEDKVQWIEE
jgi:nitroreductase